MISLQKRFCLAVLSLLIPQVLAAQPLGAGARGLEAGASSMGQGLAQPLQGGTAPKGALPPTGRRSGTEASPGPFRTGPATEPAADSPATAILPALEESDFQRFVREATGQALPLFGVSLFSQAPSTYAPVQNIAVTPDYSVGPGDELLIRVWGALDMEVRAVVDRTGQITIPQVGTFSVLGIKAAELDRHVRSKIGRVFRNFEVNVTLGQLRSMQVYVVGHARQPGTYVLSSLSTLVNALFASGGPSATGSMRHVQLKRKGVLVGELDLYDFINKGDNSGDVRLQPGDIIVIPPAGARVAVLGTVNTPAVYELKGAEASVAEVLAWGGGLPVIASTRMASLEHIQPSASTARSVTQISLDSVGQATRLRNGDMLSVHEISPKFENAVTLRGHVARPLRYRFVPGMRIKDLIPERDALVVEDYHRRNNALVLATQAGRGQVGRGRDTADETERRGQVGRGRDTADETERRGQVGRGRDTADETERRGELISRVRNKANEVNWDYAVIERMKPDDLSTMMLPFNLGKAVLDADPAHNLELKAGDIVTVFSKGDMEIPQARQTRLVSLEGEVNAAGVYRLQPGETLRLLVQRAGGLSPQAYVYGTEFTRELTRRQQQERLDQAVSRLELLLASGSGKEVANISPTGSEQAALAQILEQQKRQLARLKSIKSNGRIALELNVKATGLTDLPDLALEDGDRILIPAQHSFVMAVGAVNNDNALIWKPGRTVDEVLRLAGLLETADMDSAFLLRADGTVLSRKQHSTWLFLQQSGFERLELMPGDTVVVPEKLDHRSVWTQIMVGLKDWTQILYQMGIGIAAWKTIR